MNLGEFTFNHHNCSLRRSNNGFNSFVDPNKLFSLCVAIQKYYKSVGAITQVLPASLTSTDEVLALAGVDHITVAPPLLELLSLPDCPITPSFFDNDVSDVSVLPKTPYLKDEAAYRIAFTRDLAGASEEKLTQVSFRPGFKNISGLMNV